MTKLEAAKGLLRVAQEEVKKAEEEMAKPEVLKERLKTLNEDVSDKVRERISKSESVDELDRLKTILTQVANAL